MTTDSTNTNKQLDQVFDHNGYVLHINGKFHGYFFSIEQVFVLMHKLMGEFEKKCMQQFSDPVFETINSVEKPYQSLHTQTTIAFTWLCKKQDGSWDEMLTFQASQLKWVDKPSNVYPSVLEKSL